MRGTDFLTNKGLPLLPTLLEFTVPAVRFVSELAMEKQENISVILFSDDAKFIKAVVREFRVGIWFEIFYI
jgi:hypothetical protein